MTDIDDKTLQDALYRIARTDDGLLLYRYLQKTLCGVIQSADSSALNQDNGRRTFASELMAQMSKGIEESASGGRESARPVIFKRSASAGGGDGQRGAGRRVQLEPGDGWSPDAA
jgi:hypothetical protein